MSGEPLVSVVIPTLNAGTSFGRLLEAARGQQVPGEIELMVIDSGSQDNTVDQARAAGARVLPVRRSLFDHGRTRNQAIASATAKYVALTVQDAVPSDDRWLARLLEPLLDQPEIAGSYGLQSAPRNAGLLARTRSSLWCETHGEPRLQSLAGAEEWATLTPQERLDRIRFDNVTSCVRRAAWEAVPFPESRFGEDMGWAKGVLDAGQKLAYVPSALVWHSHERDWKYELWRSYADGANRVTLAGWPSAGLEKRHLLSIGRRLAFFVRTRRFDNVCDPRAASMLLREETRRYEPLSSSRPLQVYLAALGFGLELTLRAANLLDGAAFGEGEWVRLFRFALATTVGRALGTTAATQGVTSHGNRAFWQGLGSLLRRAA